MTYAFSWSNEDCTIILDETITLYPNLPKSVGLEVFEDDVSIGYIVSDDNGKGIYEYTPTTIGTHILKYGNIIDCRPLKVIVISPKIYLKVRLDNIFQLISNKVTSWSNKPSNDNYPSEKLVKDSLDNKASIGDLSTVATTGSYNDLSNKPTIPTVPTNISSFNNDSGYITSSSVPNPSSTTPSADTTNGSVGDGTTWARSNHTHPRSSLYAEANHTHDSIYPVYVIDNLNVDDVHYAAGHLHYESFSNAIYYSDVDGIGDIDKELAVKGDLPTIIDNLTTNDATKVLSAKQGKVLNDMIGDDDISAIGDGSVTGALTSLSDSITNHTTTFTDMIEKHTWNIPTFSLESGKGVEKTVTVPNPSGYYRVPIIQGAYKCSASSLGLSGTTLTVKIQNHYSSKANARMYGVILYIKSSIIKEI